MGQHITTKGPGDLPGDSGHPNSPYYDSSRDEWIEERADELADDLEKDEGAIRDELSYFFTVGAGDQLEDELLRFYTATRAADSNESLARAAHGLWRLLDAHISTALLARAETQAELDRDAWEEAQAEMRDHYRRKAA